MISTEKAELENRGDVSRALELAKGASAPSTLGVIILLAGCLFRTMILSARIIADGAGNKGK